MRRKDRKILARGYYQGEKLINNYILVPEMRVYMCVRVSIEPEEVTYLNVVIIKGCKCKILIANAL